MKIGLRRLRVVFFLILAAMLVAGLYPFDFYPENRVQWISNEPGLYFNGAGISNTDTAEPFLLEKAISVQLLLKERRGSKNWGPKEIFSIFDGPNSPSFLVGQWNGRIFLYSRFEKNEGKKWFKQFHDEYRLPRGKDHLVTVTFDKNEKAIFINGQLRKIKKVELNDKADITFSGSLFIGNSPRGKHGWNGEIKGVAIYNRTLLPDEIVMHSKESIKNGIGVLDKIPGCLAVYPFDEGEGNSAKNILSKTGHFYLPEILTSPALSSFGISFKEMRFYGYRKSDFFKNIGFFIPFGALLSAILLKRYDAAFLTNFLVVILAGGLLSGAIEILQLLLPTRSTDMSDILGNMLGSGLGLQITLMILKGKNL